MILLFVKLENQQNIFCIETNEKNVRVILERNHDRMLTACLEKYLADSYAIFTG